jgi:hypothetical protein
LICAIRCASTVAADLDVVGFVEMRVGVGDRVGPDVVIGEEQHALAGLVEPADGREMRELGILKAGEHRLAAQFVGSAGDEAARLVEHDVDARGLVDADVVHDDDIFFQHHGELGVLPYDQRFTFTLPMRISSVARLREQKPSLDMARASPVRGAGAEDMAQV